MNHNVVGLDIAKRVFHVYTIQAYGKVIKQMLRRRQILEFFAKEYRSTGYANMPIVAR